uniref:Gnk2-homologous domain-containing protein n=1 Tax=Chenopodium quinoa TaxID=63459 RepID=A0A803NE46_CHEQI
MMEVPYDFDDVNVGFQENDVGQGHVPHTAQHHQVEAAPATPVVPSHARRPLAESTSPTAQPAGNSTCAGLGESSGTAGSGHRQGGQQHSSTLSTAATPNCYNSSLYPLKSSYDTNLKNLLSDLVSQISTTNDTFITKRQGLQNQDTTYGLALCQGDIDRDGCNDCVKMASEEVTNECPRATQAIIWKERCMLRYSNTSFFNLLEEEPNEVLVNVNNVTDHVEDWTLSLFRDMLSNVASDAAFKSSNKYATKEEYFSPLAKYIYSLAQCNPNLTMVDCTKCFNVAINLVPNALAQGGIILTPSCTLRYEAYQFYNLTGLELSPALSIAPSPTARTKSAGICT